MSQTLQLTIIGLGWQRMVVCAVSTGRVSPLPSVLTQLGNVSGPCSHLRVFGRSVGKLATHAFISKEKRRTRSNREYELHDDGGSLSSHIPVLLGEVVDVFSSMIIHNFVDCTLGAAGHSSAIIENHSELKQFIGLDIDPVAHKLARARLNLASDTTVRVSLVLKNFKSIKSAINQVAPELLEFGVNGILMDLGMSSMQINNPVRGFSVLQDGPLDMRMDPQASLKAEDILNSWPEREVGRVLRDYGEESNWRLLQDKIVEARSRGGLHSTHQLVDLIRRMTLRFKGGGRRGWIKTATRVFQGLRIAVNDELNILKESLYESFDCLAPGGRLAVISFHSLEDRIVKQTFIDIIGYDSDGGAKPATLSKEPQGHDYKEKDSWVKQMVRGSKGIILTKRPITPSQDEERLNVRSRSAKLRVIQKF